MKMIVGLGNPGSEYTGTRHNVGFMILDSFELQFTNEKKFNALICVKNINNEKVIFVKPQTFMNNSGFSVFKVANYYNIGSEDILVIHDDMDLELGTFKIKSHGSSGGHNGIKSIIESLKTDEFCRLKVGIDHPSENTIDYVLGKFSKQEFNKLSQNYILYKEIVENFLIYDSNYLMNRYNGL